MLTKAINLLIGAFLIRQAYLLLFIPHHIHTFVTVFYPCNMPYYHRSVCTFIPTLNLTSPALSQNLISDSHNSGRILSYNP